jgi:rhamnose utilization protein RhaD (predicted bifunctional aldolase and dehydrogenase)
MLKSGWKDAAAAGLAGPEELVYRAHLLGEDPSVTNWRGGNISGKYLEPGLDGKPRRVLRVKGSGSDLLTATREDFVGVALDPVISLRSRKTLNDEEMVAFLARCLTDAPSKRPSIETLLHAFLPFEHIDHTHADAALWYGACDAGERLAGKVFGDEMAWVPYTRPGFALAKAVAGALEENPGAKGVILEKHGFLSWGRTSRECYENTLALLRRLSKPVEKRMSAARAFGGARCRPLPDKRRRGVLAEVLPPLRGALSRLRPAVLEVDESLAALEFACGKESAALAATGAATPDHLVSTKRVPLFSGWNPRESVEALRTGLLAGVETYRGEYEAWFRRHNRDPRMAMDDPYPRVIVIPGIGIVTAGKTRETALAARRLFARAIRVMKGASAQGRYVSLDEKDSFDIEYWPLERHKLTHLPRDRELTGRVALASGMTAERLAADGAEIAGTADAGRDIAVIPWGGADAAFLAARESFRVFKAQGMGGSLVFIVPPGALSAAGGSPEGAAVVHLARCLAEEGRPAGIRVNAVAGADEIRVAEAVRYLVSPRSGVTGNILNVDGGPASYAR